MKRPRYLDFECPSCGCVEERFVETEDDGTPCETQTCMNELWGEGDAPPALGYCGNTMTIREIGLTLMAPLSGKDVKTNLDDATRQRERLEKRQDDHWKRRGRDEAIETERAFLKKMNVDGGVR